jgi:hypothetical protein
VTRQAGGSLTLGDEGPGEEKMAGCELAAILAFFGVDPKKVRTLPGIASTRSSPENSGVVTS